MSTYRNGFVHLVLLFIIIISIGIYLFLNHSSKITSPNSLSPTPTEYIYEQKRSEEVPSPDGKHVAYTEDSPETIAREKERDSQGYGFVAGSWNVWVMNSNGSNKVQVTTHEDFVHRDIIKWIDNNRLLFHDGESFLQIYSLSQNKMTPLLESTEGKSYCPDSCYLLYEDHGFSPDKTYYYNLYAGKNDDTIEVANIKTLKTFTLTNIHNKCVTDITFTNDHTFIFTGSYNPPNEEDCDNAVKVLVTVDLEEKKLTVEK
jgi:WD40 repeat protein